MPYWKSGRLTLRSSPDSLRCILTPLSSVSSAGSMVNMGYERVEYPVEGVWEPAICYCHRARREG